MTNKNNKLSSKLVTHDGSFHTDDVFAAVALSMLLEKRGEAFEIIRTRDEELIKNADYVFDVGGISDFEKNRFDHHQPGGAGQHANGIEYASLGLVWKKFGAELCGSEKVANIVNERLVSPIDAWDNAIDLVTNNNIVTPYFIQNFFGAMHPTWREKTTNDEMFFKSLPFAKQILEREIIQASDAIMAEEAVIDIYKKTEDKRIIVLDKHYPFEYILKDFPEPLYVIYPRSTGNLWGVKALRNDPKTFINKKNFPTAWAGLRDEELQKVTGVSDAVFCHRGLFLTVAKSKEGAIKLTQIAVESSI
jgi:uncharacterized UPF0160 family protein